MKTRSKIFLALAGLLVTLSSVTAQINCSYVVNNPGSCPIVVDVEFFDNSAASCGSITYTIAATSATPTPCGGCSQPLSNVIVTLVSIGPNTPAGTPVVDVNTWHAQGSCAGSLCGGTGSYTMDWDQNQTFIGY